MLFQNLLSNHFSRQAAGCFLALLLLPLAAAEAAEWRRLDRQATTEYRNGNYAAAQDNAEQALTIAEGYPASGPRAARLISSLNALALIYQAQGNYPEAQKLLERAVTLTPNILGSEHPNIAVVQSNLASVKEDIRRQEVSVLAHRAQTLNEQALAQHEQGNYAEAAGLYEEALPLIENHFGAESIETARVLGSLADTYVLRQQYPQAEAIYQRALNIYETQNDALAQAGVLNELARIFYFRKQYDKSEPLFLKALELQETVLGLEHPNLLPVLDNLNALYQTRGRKSRAAEYQQRAAKIRRAQ